MSNELSKAGHTRNFIIESTAVVFNKKGYLSTSLSDITKITGLSKGSIYGNFKNKEDVALAVFDYNYVRIAKITRGQIDAAKTYYDKLMVYANVYKKVLQGEYGDLGGCPILNTAIECDDTNNQLKEKAAKALLNWNKSIGQLIKFGIAAGEFRPDVDIVKTSLSIIALIEGGVMMAKVTSDIVIMDTLMKTISHLLKGIEL